jgi:four helix bundle protein
MFPKEEFFGITSQLRRAALSVPTNIVEGSHRATLGDYLRFLDIALGSIAETGYLLEFAGSLGYISQTTLVDLNMRQKESARLLGVLINSLRKGPEHLSPES